MALERVTEKDFRNLVGGFYCQVCGQNMTEKQGGICLHCASSLMNCRPIVREVEQTSLEPRTSEQVLEQVIVKLITREVDLRNELDLTATAREYLEQLADGPKKKLTPEG